MIPKNTRILVVDDIAAMRNLTISLLRNLDLTNLVGVSNGQEALNQLKIQPFDVALVDWNMPIMNGLQLLQHVRADPSKFPFSIRARSRWKSASAFLKNMSLAVNPAEPDWEVTPPSAWWKPKMVVSTLRFQIAKIPLL